MFEMKLFKDESHILHHTQLIVMQWFTITFDIGNTQDASMEQLFSRTYLFFLLKHKELF